MCADLKLGHIEASLISRIALGNEFFQDSYSMIPIALKYLCPCENDNQRVIPVKLVLDCDRGTGIHNDKNWIPAGVYPRENGGENDSVTIIYRAFF
jgi:hypothetical protein